MCNIQAKYNILENSLIVFSLNCNYAADPNNNSHNKDRNGKHSKIIQQSQDPTEQHCHGDNKHCFSKGLSVAHLIGNFRLVIAVYQIRFSSEYCNTYSTKIAAHKNIMTEYTII